MKIIKRNGAEVPFDITKIITAVTKASDSVGGKARLSREQITDIAAAVTDQCQALNRAVSVEEVQDMVENPVEKVKSSFQTGNSIHFPVVLLCCKIRLTAVFLGGRCSGFPHRGIALNAPANHGTITAEKCGKTHRYRNTMRWRHPI